MLAFFKSRTFLTAVGLVLVALIVWFAGPYFAFADAKPLESTVTRLVVIIALVIAYAVMVQLKQAKSAKAGRELAEEVSKQDDKGAGGAGDAAQLRKRFDEAIDALKKSKQKKGAANLYELPWYIIIGPPGSGKTTVLVNSGLNFPLAQKFGKEALRGVGGTRNCDWWFTDEAILLDTAGRYTTQDSNARADAAGWGAFLQLLRKYRSRQPINGVIVAISASDLLTLGERDREQHIVAIRERLDELGRNLRIDVPVYFLVTKCDLIAGFSEFFEELGQDARAQVWGMTFPIEATETGRAAGGFGAEFDQLLERLQQRVLARMEAERDPRRRVGVLAFPQQLAQLKPLLDDMLKRVFTASDFDHQVLLRGVYLTSGTQEGTPVDRMLSAIARSFGFTSAVAAPPSGRGKAYFIERLLRNVIFQESGLAGVNRRLQLQKVVLQSGAYVACVAVLVLGVFGLVWSYNANAGYIDEVNGVSKDLAATQLAGMVGLPVDAYIPRLDLLREIVGTAEQHKDDVPLNMRIGLYRGGSIGAAARDAYVRELNGTLPTVLAARFEQQLEANVAAPDRLYEYLKGYLMLGDDDHRDATHLRFLSQLEWTQMYPGDEATPQRLAEHFEALLERDAARLESVPVRQEVIDQGRTALQNASLPVLMYSRLKLSHLDDERAVRLDIASGAAAESVLVRRSGKPLSEAVPAIYTRAVFNEFNNTGRYELLQEFAADSWVFGGDMFDIRRGGAIVYEVLNVYENDFIRAWDAVVKDVALKAAPGTQEFTDLLGIVSSPSSPLKGFLTIVAEHTNLTKPDTSAAAKATDAAEKALKAKMGALAKVMGGPPAGAAKPGAKVAAHFEPIRRLVQGPPGQSQLDQLLATLAQQHQRLQTIGSGVGEQSALDPAAQAAVADAKRSLDLVAKQLPGSVATIVSEVATRTAAIVTSEARGELARRYNEEVLRACQELVAGRYPFDRSSAVDVTLADFASVFGAGGVFDSFFRAQLAPYVDTSRSPWRWREGAAQVGGSAGMLQQFQRVQRIRDIYFPLGVQRPQANFDLTPDFLDASASRFTLEVDGQGFEYRHGPQQTRPMSWPREVGQASFAFEDRGGPIPGASKQGPWAWFRVLDQAQIERVSDTVYRVSFAAGGKTMRATLEAKSTRNPYGNRELTGFRCGA